MATNPAQQPLDPNPTPPPDERYDELSGVYGFFRRHQKKLLYTAGLFTLLTFSITGPMMDLMREWFGARQALSTISVAGKRVEMQVMDYTIGTKLANSAGTAVPWGVLPPLDPGEGGRPELGDVLAILRRAAIEEGIEVSMVEVDRAIEALREERKAESVVRLATNMSFESLADYRELMAEAMRVGTYIRLQTLAVDSTEAKVLAQVTRDREKITLRVATFDEKKLEEELKAQKKLTSAELNEWLEKKNDREKMQLQVYDLPRAELRFCGLLLAEGQFDPEQWKDDYLKDFTVGDDQLQSYYEQEKARFKLENGEFKPFEDAAVKAELTRIVQAEQVMNRLLAAVRERQTAALKPANDALATAQAEKAQAETTMRDHERDLEAKKVEVAAKETELLAKPDDASLKEAVAKLKTEQEGLAKLVFDQKDVGPAKEGLVKEAQQAIDAARIAFDLNAAFAALTKDAEGKDKKGLVQKAMSGLKNADELKDLDAAGLELGTWAQPATGTSLQNKGDLAFGPARTSKAVLIYQATDVQPKPLKAPDKLEPLLEGAYWTEAAKKQGEEKKKLMEEALLRLAKAKMPEKITEIEAKRQSRIDEKVAAWEKQNQDGIAEAERVLATAGLGQQATSAWTKKRESLQAELAMKTQRVTDFTAEVAKTIDAEIAEEAKKHYHSVLDAAATEAGFTVADLAPYARDLAQQPRFDKVYDPTVVYLFRSQSQLKLDEATGVLQDFANRRWLVAACTKVEPLSVADVTRREFEALRTGNGRSSYADDQAFMLYRQAFTREAIEQRYDLKRPVGEQRESSPVDTPKGDVPKVDAPK